MLKKGSNGGKFQIHQNNYCENRTWRSKELNISVESPKVWLLKYKVQIQIVKFISCLRIIIMWKYEALKSRLLTYRRVSMYHNIVRRPGEILKSNNSLNNDKLENSELNPYSQVVWSYKKCLRNQLCIF